MFQANQDESKLRGAVLKTPVTHRNVRRSDSGLKTLSFRGLPQSHFKTACKVRYSGLDVRFSRRRV
jgi:hypothetical protein